MAKKKIEIVSMPEKRFDRLKPALIKFTNCRHDIFTKCRSKNPCDQPERSKRENLDCCKRVKDLEEVRDAIIEDRLSVGSTYRFYDDSVILFNTLIEESKMRCSEHSG